MQQYLLRHLQPHYDLANDVWVTGWLERKATSILSAEVPLSKTTIAPGSAPHLNLTSLETIIMTMHSMGPNLFKSGGPEQYPQPKISSNFVEKREDSHSLFFLISLRSNIKQRGNCWHSWALRKQLRRLFIRTETRTLQLQTGSISMDDHFVPFKTWTPLCSAVEDDVVGHYWHGNYTTTTTTREEFVLRFPTKIGL